jgi:hypothetical protein
MIPRLPIVLLVAAGATGVTASARAVEPSPSTLILHVGGSWASGDARTRLVRAGAAPVEVEAAASWSADAFVEWRRHPRWSLDLGMTHLVQDVTLGGAPGRPERSDLLDLTGLIAGARLHLKVTPGLELSFGPRLYLLGEDTVGGRPGAGPLAITFETSGTPWGAHLGLSVPACREPRAWSLDLGVDYVDLALKANVGAQARLGSDWLGLRIGLAYHF